MPKNKYEIKEVIYKKIGPNWVQNHFQIEKRNITKYSKRITKSSDINGKQ